ncbi:MAG: TlpA family protein disulfide reductase [Bacteroidales bacterium]|nr:TlpA family protein disulfide reductase [Bacteroidales bacterium]
MKKTITLLAITLLVTTAFAKQATLKGKVINNKKYNEIHLQDLSYKNIETQTIDENGNFEFETTFNKFEFYILSFEKGKFVAFFPEPGEKTEMIIDIKDLQNPIITNSVHSVLYYEYSNKLSKADNEGKRVALIKKMIDENTNSPACILFAGILGTEKYKDYHTKLSDGLKAYSGNSMVSDFIKQTNNIKNLSVGGEAPEIELKNPDGKNVKLSSTRGNYVLIDFWASWCRPCRAENPNNVRLYEKYHDKGFEIYAVSLDKDRASWLKAIKDDNLTWIHVSDLKFWQSKGAKTYNVRGIPHTVLLDKKGKILATGLRGKALEDKLKELFGE